MMRDELETLYHQPSPNPIRTISSETYRFTIHIQNHCSWSERKPHKITQEWFCAAKVKYFLRNPLGIPFSVCLLTSWWCLREWVSHGASIPRPQECQSFRSCDALPCSCHALPVPQNHFFPALPSHLPLLAAQQEEGRRPFCLIRCGWVGGWAVEHVQFSGTLVFRYVTVNCSTGLWVIMLSYLGAGWNVSHVDSLLFLLIGSFYDTYFIECNMQYFMYISLYISILQLWCCWGKQVGD